jgi:hypothetical protein
MQVSLKSYLIALLIMVALGLVLVWQFGFTSGFFLAHPPRP